MSFRVEQKSGRVDLKLGKALCIALVASHGWAPVRAEPITRYEVIDEWSVECRSQDSSVREKCVVRSGPYIARTGQGIAGFSLSVRPKENTFAVESLDALGLEAKVDDGELFSAECDRPACAFPSHQAGRLLEQMKVGRVLLTRVVTSDGEVIGRLALDDFRDALAIAKQPRTIALAEDLTSVEVRLMQSLLLDLGYKPGPSDGKLGPKTQRAIKAYQEDRSLIADGRPTKMLLYRLRAGE